MSKGKRRRRYILKCDSEHVVRGGRLIIRAVLIGGAREVRKDLVVQNRLSDSQVDALSRLLSDEWLSLDGRIVRLGRVCLGVLADDASCEITLGTGG